VTTRLEEKDETKPTADEIAEAIVAAMPVLDLSDQRIMLSIRRLMAKGEPVAIDAIAQASGVPRGELESKLAWWPGVYRNDEGRVVGFWGQAIDRLDPEYRLTADGKATYTWCALDTLFIPGQLGQRVLVEASDPIDGGKVSLVVDRNGAHDVSPSGAAVSMVVPDGPFGFDVIESFCHRVLFFTSPESGEKWTAKHPGTIVLSVQEAFEVGRALNAGVLPDLLTVESGLRL